jgi:integrase
MGNVMDMPRPRLPYLHRETSRHGKTVWYVRRSLAHTRIRLHGEYGSPEFVAAYEAALRGEVLPKDKARPVQGSFTWLVTQWQASTDWHRMKPATRRQRANILARMISENRNAPFAVTKAMIERGLARRQDKPFAADNWLKVMKALYAWAATAGHMPDNPAAGVKLLNRKTSGHTPWTPEAIMAFERHWGPETKERVWLHIMLYTGLRVGDAFHLGKQHVRDGWVTIRTEKTGAMASFPMLPQLAETLANGRTGDMAYICAESGLPFQTKQGFANAFRKACAAAGVKGYSPHGLRKALATMMAGAGVSELQLQAWFTWTDNRTSSVYTKTAARELLANEAATRLQQHISATSISAPQNTVRKSGEIS